MSLQDDPLLFTSIWKSSREENAREARRSGVEQLAGFSFRRATEGVIYAWVSHKIPLGLRQRYRWIMIYLVVFGYGTDENKLSNKSGAI